MLDQLVQTQKENNSRLASIEKSIQGLLKVNRQTAAREKVESKRAANLARRERSYSKGGASKVGEKMRAKEGAKNIFGALFDFLKGPIGKAAIVGLLGYGIFKVFTDKKTQKMVGDAMVAGWNFVKPYIEKAFQAAGKFILDAARSAAELLGKAIRNAFNWATKSVGNIFSGNQTNWQLDTERRLATTKQERAELEKINKILTKKQQLERIYYKRVYALEKMKDKGYSEGRLARQQREVNETKEELNLVVEQTQAYRELAEEKGFYREQDFRMRRAEETTFGWMNDRTFYHGKVNMPYLGARGYKVGGPVRVPGSGDGDKVAAVVSPGSFVLNKKASNVMGYATGGIPVMLEPGEQVYGPGSWGPAEMMMNAMVPRFASGGKVDQKNPTGAQAAGTNVPDRGKQIADISKVTPGGRVEFIGTGDGISGELRIIDGVGKTVGSFSAVSGVNRTAKSTQEQRMNIPGKLLPVPDGNYPLLPIEMVPGDGVGDWKVPLNNWHGQIGKRGGILIHNDLGTSGTAGCIGVEGIGGRGSKKSMQLAKLLQEVQPSSIKVNLMSDKGQPAGSQSNTGSSGGNPFGAMGEGFMGGANFLGGAATGGLRDAGLPGLADYMDMFGQGVQQSKLGSMAASGLGALYNFGKSFIGTLMGGFMNPAMAGATGDTSGDGDKGSHTAPGGGGNVSVSDPNARALLQAISQAEGTPSYGTMFGGKVNADLASGRLTVNQAYQAGMRNPGSGATGKYQFMPQTMKDLINAGVWNPNEKLTNALQDKGAMWLVQKKRKVNLEDGLSQKEIQALSWEWASIKGNNYTYGGRPQGYVGQDEFAGWYKSNGGKLQGMQTGGVVNMQGGGTPNMQRYKQAMDTFKASMATNSMPVIVPIPMGGGGKGGGQTPAVTGQMGTPMAPTLPDGPQVVAMLELQNRLALGAAI
jgi:muramidase (phage lysozyme)